MLKQFLPLLSVNHRKTVVQAMITSRLDYANILYLGIPEYMLSRLQVVQNAAARAILMLGFRTRMSPYLVSLHWLPIRKQISFKVGILACKALHGIGAPYLRKIIQFHRPCRLLQSSSLHLATIPRFSRSRIGGRSFQVSAAKFWNSLPLALRQIQDLLPFRKALKTWLFQQ